MFWVQKNYGSSIVTKIAGLYDMDYGNGITDGICSSIFPASLSFSSTYDPSRSDDEDGQSTRENF